MLNFTTFKSKENLEKYIADYWSHDLEVHYFPVEYPCIGFIYMCPDESYDMKFLSKGDIQRMSDELGVWPLKQFMEVFVLDGCFQRHN